MHLHRSIYHAEDSKHAQFHNNPLQTCGNTGSQTCHFLQRMYARGHVLVPTIPFVEVDH